LTTNIIAFPLTPLPYAEEKLPRIRSSDVNPLNLKEKIQWVRPKLVREVEYAELTADDQLRQTTFLGWRDDKKAKEVVLENRPIVA
jgi:ATP-dependent DNA ligase